jgi:hypothetical protein
MCVTVQIFLNYTPSNNKIENVQFIETIQLLLAVLFKYKGLHIK